MIKISKLILFLSRLADRADTSQEERLQHSFLIYMGLLMSVGGILWGTICFLSGLQTQASIPFVYAIITFINFTYLYYSKNFKLVQFIQVLISLLLPFFFQFAIGGFVASGGVIWWSILSILAGFAFQHRQTTLKWFLIYLSLVIISAVFDGANIFKVVEVPKSISILFFAMNITWISIIIYTLFYYFVDSELKFRHSLEVSEDKLKVALKENQEYLQITQNQLIESEKMSALGNLVAGVAHEVNTPLGISITAASIYDSKIKELKSLIKDNTLSKSVLNNTLDSFEEANTILVKNLSRAALLIKNFKQISVDQTSDNIRDFELNEYIKEIVFTLHNEFKHRPIELSLELCKEELLMHSNPGAISQVMVNILQNTLFHAFDIKDEGKVVIETKAYDKYALIRVSDNGKGVNKEISEKIFEPFVTSKPNTGGTGLGLSITHALIDEILGGSIVLDHEYKNGTSFIIKIPYLIAQED
ncbi:MAG: hypothetical protein COA44_03215 [Arcobacter sp.]|nr:MAG: hypothetical protein COA44_03215 [Arcobacter sp.]